MFPFYYYPLTAAEKTWRISIFLCRVDLAKLHSCCLPTKPWASRIWLHHPGNLQEEETENRNLKTAPHPHLWQKKCQRNPVLCPLSGRCLLALSLQSTSMLSLRCNKLSHWKILFYLPGKLATWRLCFEIHILTTNYIALSLWWLRLCQVDFQSRLWSAQCCFIFPGLSLPLGASQQLTVPGRNDAHWA